MDINGAKILMAGATGHLGGLTARELASAGGELFLAGRHADRLRALGEELDAPTGAFDLTDEESCERVVEEAAEALGGLDVLWVSTGVAAFGSAAQLDADATRQLFQVNVIGPIALLRAALPRLSEDGAIVAFSAIVADFPTADMAAYSATKAGLSAYLAAVRRERRRDGLTVLDLRPQHMETGFSERPLAGHAPELPEPVDAGEVVEKAIGALREGKREMAWNLKDRALVVS